MKQDKQNALIECFKAGKYRLSASRDHIESFVKGKWRELKANTLPTGYCQITMFGKRRSGIRVTVYEHVAVYIAVNGIYPEGMQIDHVDRVRGNNHIDNLRPLLPIENQANRLPFATRHEEGIRPIRAEQIKEIRKYHALGHSQSGIAKALNLNRLSVRYTIKQIEAGIPLKYE